MKVVVQRSKAAAVTSEGKLLGQITQGLVLLVGVTHEDTEQDARYLADKIVNLRIFEDEQGRMNRSLLDLAEHAAGEAQADEGLGILSVSQFTLYGDCRKGRRPSFAAAARPEQAEQLYEHFNAQLRSCGVAVETGKFGAMMDVTFTNWGPVTLILES